MARRVSNMLAVVYLKLLVYVCTYICMFMYMYLHTHIFIYDIHMSVSASIYN